MTEQVTANIPQIDLDDYDIIEYISKGAFSVICKGRDKKTQKEVAIKAYIPTDDKEKTLNGYVRGVNVSCSGVSCLVKTIGYRYKMSDEERKNSKYLRYKIDGSDKPVDLTGFIVVTDYYKIHDIITPTREYINSEGAKHELMNPTIRSKIIFGVSSIMKQLHNKNIIYRDLKPENVYLTDELEPVIGDFELSKFIVDPLNMTMAIGTPINMAPEMFMDGDDTYSFEVDVFGYAMFLYRMFSARIEFSDKKPLRSPQQYLMKIGKGQRPVKPDLMPDHYWELVQKCWKQDPDERPTFDEITEILRNDKFALNEFGMNTDVDELHQYQNKIDPK